MSTGTVPDASAPLISVVIPARDRAHTIGRCVRSVLAQKYRAFEVVVVDDGSRDATVETVVSLGDPRIRLIENTVPRGAQAARNAGIRAAAAEWVAFLDSDDEWLPDKLARQVDALRLRDYAPNIVVNCGTFRHDASTGERHIWHVPIVHGPSSYLDVLRRPGPTFHTLLAAKDALENIGLLDERVPSFQEWDTAIRLARGCEFVHVAEPLAVYWIHQTGSISADFQGDAAGYRYVIEKHKAEIERLLGRRAWQHHLAALVRRYARVGNLAEAEMLLRQLPWLDPNGMLTRLRVAGAYLRRLGSTDIPQQ